MSNPHLEGWTVAGQPNRAWHFFRLDSQMFARFRSLCQGYSLTGEIRLVNDWPAAAAAPVCEPCRQARLCEGTPPPDPSPAARPGTAMEGSKL